MKKILLIVFTLNGMIFPQLNDSLNFHSPDNINKFADHLYYSKDYFRASLEYERLLNFVPNDTTVFKIGLAKQNGKQYNLALSDFNDLINKKSLLSESYIQYYKTLFLAEYDSLLITSYSNRFYDEVAYHDIHKLYFLSLIRSGQIKGKDFELLERFNKEEKTVLKRFLERKIQPDHKSPILAAVLSSVIPGLGKIYTARYEEGIAAFLLTTVFGYLSYTNFEADHKIRGWIFAGTSFLFYAGNIYGSAASANIYNAAVNLRFDTDFNFYLKNNDYLITKEPVFK